MMLVTVPASTSGTRALLVPNHAGALMLRGAALLAAAVTIAAA
eukprot:COSAG06_NODE_33061_length_495_cov_1274.477273_1_plen_42_part_10